MFRVWVCCLIIFFFSLTNMAAEPLRNVQDGTDDIQTLNSLVEKGNHSEAIIKIQELLQKPQYTRSPELLHNLGLVEWNLNQLGPALSHFRQAFFLSPYSTKLAQTLSWAEKQTEQENQALINATPLIYKLSLWIQPLSLWILSLLSLFFCGALILRDDSDTPLIKKFWRSSPWLFLSLILWSLSLWLTQVQSTPIATIITETHIPIYAAPSEQSARIDQAYPGDAVWVLQSQPQWTQIQSRHLPSGWVSTSSVEIYSPFD